jgi:hypothetical protein
VHVKQTSAEPINASNAAEPINASTRRSRSTQQTSRALLAALTQADPGFYYFGIPAPVKTAHRRGVFVQPGRAISFRISGRTPGTPASRAF